MDTSTITVPRSNVTADEVTAVLRGRLGSRYTITPGKRATDSERRFPAMRTPC